MWCKSVTFNQLPEITEAHAPEHLWCYSYRNSQVVLIPETPNISQTWSIPRVKELVPSPLPQPLLHPKFKDKIISLESSWRTRTLGDCLRAFSWSKSNRSRQLWERILVLHYLFPEMLNSSMNKKFWGKPFDLLPCIKEGLYFLYRCQRFSTFFFFTRSGTLQQKK